MRGRGGDGGSSSGGGGGGRRRGLMRSVFVKVNSGHLHGPGRVRSGRENCDGFPSEEREREREREKKNNKVVCLFLRNNKVVFLCCLKWRE